MDESLKEQTDNTSKPWLFKKGVSGNPMGRPPGRSLKDRAKAYLAGLSDEEAIEFWEGLPKELVWKMAEGNPKQDNELTGNLTISQVLDNLESDGHPPQG